MATNVTILNIGTRTETINGSSVAPGATLVVDLEDVDVQRELRQDLDYVILPDSAAGTLPAGGGDLVAWESFPQFDYGDGISGGDVFTPTGDILTYVGDGADDYELTLNAPTFFVGAPVGEQVQLQIVFTEEGAGINSARITLDSITGLGVSQVYPVNISVPVPAFVGSRDYSISLLGNGAAHTASIASANGPYQLSLRKVPS